MPDLTEYLLEGTSSPPSVNRVAPMGGHFVPLPYFIDLRARGLPYAVAKYPITNECYVPFLNIVTCMKLPYLNDNRFKHPHQPVVGINLRDAEEYCGWVSTLFSSKIDLPDRDIWRKIARCETGWEYSTQTGELTPELANVGLTVGSTSRVNAYPPNPLGVHDMTGNVLEWTKSIPTEIEMKPEYGAMPIQKTQDLAKNRILMGGCWAFSGENSKIDATIIFGLFSNYYTTGFRPIVYFED